MNVLRLDSSSIPASVLGYDITEGEAPPQALSTSEAVDRAIAASRRPVEPDVAFEAVYGQLTSRNIGYGTRTERDYNNRFVWVVRIKGIKRLIRNRRVTARLVPPQVIRASRWLVIDAHTGELMKHLEC